MKIYSVLFVAGALVACGPKKEGAVEVELCDGKTTHTVQAGAVTKEEAQALSAALMAKWQAANPGKDWVVEELARHELVKGADNSALAAKSTQGHAYGEFSAIDIATWDRETQKLVVAGSKVFHDGKELGSTISVSCDMCHPHASNTHPETYPKFQTQMGRTVLLRDMINWCLQHPVRAPAMAEDDPRMRAMEAYILAQRRGKALDYNRH